MRLKNTGQNLEENLDALFEGSLEDNIRSQGRFGNYSPMYAFATENIAGYYRYLDFRRKKVLTVGGSGDHIINAYMSGASEVEAFDCNNLSAFITDLKQTAMETCSFDRFRDFLLREHHERKNPGAMDFNIYQEIRKNLSDPAAAFFDKAYHHFDNDGASLRESLLFRNTYDTNEKKIISNFYLQSRSKYRRAKKYNAYNTRKEVEWYCNDIRELPSALPEEKKYDIILLSNIADYANEMFPENHDYLDLFCEQAVNPLKPHLTQNGVICSAYIYADYNNLFSWTRRRIEKGRGTFRSDIDNPKKREEAFRKTGLNYLELSFQSVMRGEKDAMIFLR